MAKKMKKLISLILALSMVMSLLTVGVFATEEGEETLPANHQQVEYAGGSASKDGVTVSKKITGTDDENIFDITLTVDTQKNIKEVYSKAQSTAVVIVMDVSHTMKEQFGNTNRYEAAVAAASSFMESYADIENPADAERKLGFVVFNTDAHEIFGMSDCKTAKQAEDLIKLMDANADELIGADDFCGGHDGYCADSNVSKCAFYDEHSKASNAANSARFTNIEAGLKMGADMLKESGAVNQYIVFLSDGFPTTYLIKGRDDYAGYNPYCSSGRVGKDGVFYDQKTSRYCDYGTSYSDKGAERAQDMAASIKATGAKIYSIGVDVEGQSIQDYIDRGEGKTFSVVDCYGSDKDYVIGDFKAWLRGSANPNVPGIGSGYYWDSTNANQMNAAFAGILTSIKDSVETNSQASWVASDPMNTLNSVAIDFLQFYNKEGQLVSSNLTGPAASENTASFANDAINWDLKNSVCTETKNGNVTTYHYELKYRVRLANEAAGFVENENVKTNGTTTLKYQQIENVNGKETLSETKSVTFPIPEVEGYLAELTFKKTDSTGELGLEGATFTLIHKSNCNVCKNLVNADLKFPACYTAVSAADGTVTFTGIPSGHDYVLEETVAPQGYALNTAKYDVTVGYDVLSVVGHESFDSVVNTKLNKLTITKVVDVPEVTGTNVHAEMLTDAVLAGTTYTFDVVGVKNGKTVYDNDHSITVAAVTEGEDDKTVITGSVELNNLPDGTYTVTEQGEGTYTYGGATYTVAATYEGNGVALDDGDEVTVNVKNTYTYNPEYVQVNVTKDWQDANNQDGKRPASITYNLYADADTTDEVAAEKIDSKTVSSADNWSANFIRLPKYENGKKITYTVTEDEVAEYTSAVEEGSSTTEAIKVFVVTNSHTPEVTSVHGVKTWNDENNADGKRPTSITVNLLKNGEEIAEKTVTLRDNWSYSWDNLAKYENGQLISYSVSEDPVADYTASYSGYNITNTYVPGKTDIVAVKAWDDADNQDGIRASSVTVQLKADGEAVGEAVTLDASNDWRYTWKSLNYNKNGGKIVYTVEEVEVPDGYTASVTNEGYVYTVKNTHVPEVTSVTVNKVWAASAERLMQPVTMNLYADGELIDSKTLNASNQWTYTWTNLAKNKAGVAISYTVDEEDLGSYWYKKVSNEGNIWTVENSYYVPVYTSRTVVKVWDDNDNAAETRPESVTVQLLYNGAPYGAAVTLSEANGWSHTWERLSDVDAWSITEVNVPEGYISKVELSGTTYTVTNTYGEEEFPEEDPPTSNPPEFPPENPPEEEIPEEDVPLADVPATGDMTALWAAASVVSAAGLLFLGKKNKDEE